MKQVSGAALAGLVLTLMQGVAAAAPVPKELSAFDAATTVDFLRARNGGAVTDQYSPLGVSFSGALFGMTNFGDRVFFPDFGDLVIASNFVYSKGGSQGTSFTAQFESTQVLAGFYLKNSPSQLGTVELFQGNVSRGVIDFGPTHGDFAEFFGVEEDSGFDRLVFTNHFGGDDNGFFAIDDFKFGASVPEPQALALMLAGLGVLGATLARRGVGRVRYRI